MLLPGLLFVACFTSCSSILPTESEVASLIQEAVDQRKMLIILEPTSFDWDRVYFFPPYSTAAGIQEVLEAEWPDAATSRVIDLDTHTLVVFTDNAQVVHAFDYPRDHADFSHLGNTNGYPRNDAVFTIFLNEEKSWPKVEYMPRLSWLTSQ